MDLTSADFSSVYNFATTQGRTIHYLHMFDMLVCALIFFTVLGLIIAVAIKFRDRGDDKEPEQIEGNIKYELTWTIIPAIVFLTLGILTANVMDMVNPPLKSRQPDIVVVGHQFWWEYRYPKAGVVAANEMYMPEGVDSVLEMQSADVIHSFWVPDFGQKVDCIPGMQTHMVLKPIRSGLFSGSCSEFCGADHSLMRIVVNVVPQKDFDAWLKKQAKIPTAASDADSQQGQQIFMSQTCSQCHAIDGTSAKANVGPNLSHLADRKTIGSGLLENNTDNVTKWIMNAQQFKPGCHMPNMRLKDKEAHDIAVYLENLK